MRYGKASALLVLGAAGALGVFCYHVLSSSGPTGSASHPASVPSDSLLVGHESQQRPLNSPGLGVRTARAPVYENSSLASPGSTTAVAPPIPSTTESHAPGDALIDGLLASAEGNGGGPEGAVGGAEDDIERTEALVRSLVQRGREDPALRARLLERFLAETEGLRLHYLGRVLGALRDPDLEARLLDCADSDPCSTRRAAAIKAATRLGEQRPSVIGALGRALGGGVAPEVRSAALSCLAMKVHGEWPAGLQEAVVTVADDTTAPPDLRADAWIALRLRSLNTLELDRARRTARDGGEDPRVRIAALGILGTMGGPSDRVAIQALVASERDPHIRTEAEAALRKLSGSR